MSSADAAGLLRIALSGAAGRMGQAIADAVAEDPNAEIVAAWTHPEDPAVGERLAGTEVRLEALGPEVELAADVVIDFSRPEALATVADRCEAQGVPLVTGTTGFEAPHEARVDALAEQVAVVAAPNMSVGVTLLFHLAELATRLAGPDFDPEIVEMHHRHKVDAPSGTAIRLAEHVAAARDQAAADVVLHGRSGVTGPRTDAEIGVMSLRGGGVVGEHTLYLAGAGERLELTHRARDRSIFATGALRAAHWVVGAEAGRHGMRDVLGIA